MQLLRPTAARFEHECTQEALRNAYRVEFLYDNYGAVVARFFNGPYFLYDRTWQMGVVS